MDKITPKITILSIDDEIVSRYSLAALLDSERYTLIFAESGKEGLDKAQQIKPDLILLDIMMPLMNGFETCRRLRAQTTNPIIMITAWDDPIAHQRSLDAGANAVLAKPINRRDLNDLIQHLHHSTTTP